MAGPIRLKLGGMVEGMQENVLAKQFFGSVEVDQGQVGGPQVPLLGRGDDKETPNLTCCPTSSVVISCPLDPSCPIWGLFVIPMA